MVSEINKPFRVKYYDARMSRIGQGVQVMAFETKEAAEAFASKNKIYGKPCTVEIASPLQQQWEKQDAERIQKSLANAKWARQRRY